MKNKITTQQVQEMLALASIYLKNNTDYLNSLNVFPVPDGDTGTNMSATLSEAVRHMITSNPTSVDTSFAELSKGSLMGARGNSGVILSQIVRGLSKGLSGADSLTVEGLVKGFCGAKETSYKSVMQPKEGTILSVIRAIAESAVRNADVDEIGKFIDIVLADGIVMLEATKDMLPENKKAGTVDAGGAGLIVIIQAIADSINGRSEQVEFDFNTESFNAEHIDVHHNSDDILYQYCTEFIILSPANELDLRAKLSDLGDSIVVVTMDDITKVHIHTNSPGTALNIASQVGDLTRIKIDNMKEQSDANTTNKATESVQKEQAVIAVATGDGVIDLFMESGADYVVGGGQSMNPSVEDLVRAVKKVNAKNVVILPNNKNIILAAEQVADLVECNVGVVKTKTIPQGLTALLSFNNQAPFENNLACMSDSLSQVFTCQITTAVKDSNMNDLSISKDDYLGILEDSIVSNGVDMVSVFSETIAKVETDDLSIITIITGSSMTEIEISSISTYLEKNYPDLEILIVDGKQDVYKIIAGLE